MYRSEERMRQHSKAQHSIPNNLRPTNYSANNGNNSQISNQDYHSKNNQQIVNPPSISSSSISNTKYPNQSQGTIGSTLTVRTAHQRDVKTRRNEWRITKMVLAIFLSFVLCYLPITIAKICDKEVKLPGLHVIGYIMLYLSACINPIIYVIMNKQYRQAYKTILLCRTPRLLSMTNIGQSAGGK